MRRKKGDHVNLLFSFSGLILFIFAIVLIICSYPRNTVYGASAQDISAQDSSAQNPAEAQQDSDAPIPKYKSISELKGKRIGIATGMTFDRILDKLDLGFEYSYFNTVADHISALKSRKVDAICFDNPVARSVQAENPSICIMPGEIETYDIGFIFPKNDRGKTLCDELSEFIRTLKADGTLESLQKKWFDSADFASVESLDYRELPDVKGTIRLATIQYQPFNFMVDGLFKGYETEIVAMFCRDNGYALQITDLNTEGFMSTVQSGKCDIGASCMTITPERQEKLYFTEPSLTCWVSLMVLNEREIDEGGFFSGIVEKFEKTFIRENRWKLFLSGIGTTLLITALSILFGTLLGFFLFMICRNGNPAANTITRFCVWLVQGMPVVVLLMILYYIIFGKTSIPGATVAVIAFTLIFGSAVYGMLRSGVSAIGPGQLEAAYSLGYSNRRAFYRIILPQAMPYFMPAYKVEITSLIKATAVVGYVAVEDITKVGDIIRSRTYEAFFPLIAVAIIYYVMAAVLTFFVKKIEFRIDPRRRDAEDILKGVVRE